MREKIIRSLCLPVNAYDYDSFPGLAASYAQATRNRLSNRLREMEETDAADFLSALPVSAKSEYWSPEIGVINERLTGACEFDTLKFAAQYLLLAWRLGDAMGRRFSLDLKRPCTLFWNGAPCGDILHIDILGDAMRIRTARGKCSVVTHKGAPQEEGNSLWILTEDRSVCALADNVRPVVIDGKPLDTNVIFGALARDRLSWSIEGHYDGPYAAEEKETVLAVDAGLSLLGEIGVDLLLWVLNASRYIALICENTDERCLSGSGGSRPGFIYMQSSARASLIAEQLVHEASHQYYEFLAMLYPVAEGEALFYSPIKRAYRTLNQNMIAYHAVINILSYYLRLAALDEKRADLKEVRRFEGMAAAYEETFRNADGLSENGRLVFEELSTHRMNLSGERHDIASAG